MAALHYAEAEARIRRGGHLEGATSQAVRCARVGADVHPGPSADGVRPGLAVLAVVLLLLAGPVLAGEVADGRGAGSPSSSGENRADMPAAGAGGRVHVVQPGETYWSIAVALGGERNGDLRPVVEALAAANGDGPLLAGDRVVLPPTRG